MEWVDRLNAAIRYIEEHLTDEIDYEQPGQIACCSSYHFQRMFGYMAGVTLPEYIRKRRMSLAAVDLQNGNEKITAIHRNTVTVLRRHSTGRFRVCMALRRLRYRAAFLSPHSQP